MSSKWVSLWSRAAVGSRLGKPKPFLTTYSNENFLLKNMSDESREDLHPIKSGQLQPPMESTNKWEDKEIALAKERETVTCLQSRIAELEKNLADTRIELNDVRRSAKVDLETVHRTKGKELSAVTAERKHLERETIDLKKNIRTLEYSRNWYVERLQNLASQLEVTRNSMERMQHENDHKLEEFEILQFLCDKSHSDNEELDRCLKELQTLLETASAESEDKSKSLAQLQRSLDTTSAENQELKRLLEASDKCMECLMVEDVRTIFGIRAAPESDGDAEEVDAARKKLHDAQQRNKETRESLERERAGFLEQIHSLQAEMGRGEKQKQKLEAENGALVARVRDTNNMINGLTDDVRRLQRKKENLEEQMAEYEMVCNESRRLQGDVMEAAGEITSQKSRVDSLSEELNTVQALLETRQSDHKALQESLRNAQIKLQFQKKTRAETDSGTAALLKKKTPDGGLTGRSDNPTPTRSFHTASPRDGAVAHRVALGSPDKVSAGCRPADDVTSGSYPTTCSGRLPRTRTESPVPGTGEPPRLANPGFLNIAQTFQIPHGLRCQRMARTSQLTSAALAAAQNKKNVSSNSGISSVRDDYLDSCGDGTPVDEVEGTGRESASTSYRDVVAFAASIVQFWKRQ